MPRAQVPGVSGPSNVQSKAFLGAQRMVGTQVRGSKKDGGEAADILVDKISLGLSLKVIGPIFD